MQIDRHGDGDKRTERRKERRTDRLIDQDEQINDRQIQRNNVHFRVWVRTKARVRTQ